MLLEINQVQHLQRDVLAPRLRHTLKAQAERDIVEHVEPGHQRVLLEDDTAVRARPKHRFTVQTHLASGGLNETGDAVQQGRLAATGRAQRDDELTGFDAQIDIGERDVRRRAARAFVDDMQPPDLKTAHRRA
ncbi:MAG: hypothetical protein QOC89_2435 [Paraburkholderia sp.]|nr:hypothetical protein [Paraburkholderia sp.]